MSDGDRRTDAELVRRALAGERSAYAELYDRYARWIRATCFEVTHRLGEAQDLAQDVFLRAYKRLDQLNAPERFGPWLHSIAQYRCLEWLREDHRRRDRALDFDFDQVAAPAEPSDDDVRELRRALMLLPEKDRTAIHAFYLLGQPVDEVRSVLKLSRPGLYRTLQRARERLCEIMSRSTEKTP